MEKKELEDQIKKLKISGWDIRVSIDIAEARLNQTKQQYNNIVFKVNELAIELALIQEKEKTSDKKAK